jgi:hypothetical protein
MIIELGFCFVIIIFLKNAGLPIFVIGVIGTSLAVLVAAIAHFSLSRRG